MKPSTPLLARLPAPMQAQLREIGSAARDLFGELRDIQEIIDAHVAFLDALAGAGATHAMLVRLLAEVGIARPDGTPLPIGTLSGGLSRARRRSPRRRCPFRQRPADPCSPLQHPAGPSGTRHATAEACPAPPHPAGTGRSRYPLARARRRCRCRCGHVSATYRTGEPTDRRNYRNGNHSDRQPERSSQ